MGFPRPKMVDFGPISCSPYGHWRASFLPLKKPENKPKNIFKKFSKKSPKLPIEALFDKKFQKTKYPPNIDLQSPN
jgi:hypothetical protein